MERKRSSQSPCAAVRHAEWRHLGGFRLRRARMGRELMLDAQSPAVPIARSPFSATPTSGLRTKAVRSLHRVLRRARATPKVCVVDKNRLKDGVVGFQGFLADDNIPDVFAQDGPERCFEAVLQMCRA
jgi:hypothetical protein